MKGSYEILAPAGNTEALKAAVQNGADAVYLSGKAFGARQFAGNFTEKELINAVVYCHIRGVSVYVTVNTLVLKDEMKALKAYLDFLYLNDVDAVIVQDMGVLQYIRNVYPEWSVHCSTQMSVQTVADIHFLEKMGVQRVVIGREMSLETLRKAKQQSNLQLEVFVHGALCISVSGQCLMSSMIGGRSGNRGRCAQPCRQQYKLVHGAEKKVLNDTDDGYLLSPKDLSTFEDIKQVVEAGAYSLKIEGRMKSPEYVATVVRAYRSMLDSIEQGGKPDVASLEKEMTIFNRGFTKGHLFGDRGKSLMNPSYPGNQGYLIGTVTDYDTKKQKATLKLKESLSQNDEIQIRRRGKTVGGRVEKLEIDGTLLKRCPAGESCKVYFKHNCHPGESVYKTYDETHVKHIRETYHKEMLKIPVTMEVSIKEDKQISGEISDNTNKVKVCDQTIPEKAFTKALTKEKVATQLSKLGGTPFEAQEVRVRMEPGLTIPIKKLNELRRDLVDGLMEKRAIWYRRSTALMNSNSESAEPAFLYKKPKEKPDFSCSVTTLGQLQALLELNSGTGIHSIYYREPDTLEDAVELVWKYGFDGKLIPELFKMTPDNQLLEYKQKIQELGLDTVLVQNPGHMLIFDSFNKVGDASLNVVNDAAYGFYKQSALLRVTLSPELNLRQIKEMNLEPARTEIIGYGFLPVMALKHCVLSEGLDCKKNKEKCKKEPFYLKDRKSEHFPIKPRHSCYTEVYNSRKLFLLENIKDLTSAGMGTFRLHFLQESKEETAAVLRLHINMVSGVRDSSDEKLLQRLKEEGVTRGHLYRGVQ
ncbi:MAG: U32 family peptidase [Tindallia sp. MSAO_Bac2]|nr:MAG: U32 family peptidase [Tindallia sp. MSAO_Bac2]